MKIAFKNSKILIINGRTLTPVPGQGPEPGLHYVYASSDGHGSVSASPMSGKKDTLIALSNTPAQNYIFSKYTLNNVDLAGSSFLMPDEDAYVRGYFQPDVRTITVTQPSHGTITAPASAQIGSLVVLSSTADSGYELQNYTVDGTEIVGNTFTMPAHNVTVSAVFESTGPVFDEVTIGNQTWMAKNLAIDDGQGGIYHQTVNYGQGDVVEYYYDWNAAVRIAASIPGWHLPTQAEWDTLANTLGGRYYAGDKLKATYSWGSSDRGTDNYGFTALPAGFWNYTFNGFRDRACFWSATEDSTYAYYNYILPDNSWLESNSNPKYFGYSIRLVKDS